MNGLDAVQTVIAISGVLSILITQLPYRRPQRWACLIGLVGQPFWLVITYSPVTLGMFAVSVATTLAWLVGVWRYWGRA